MPEKRPRPPAIVIAVQFVIVLLMGATVVLVSIGQAQLAVSTGLVSGIGALAMGRWLSSFARRER
jgi:hypothetical protein